MGLWRAPSIAAPSCGAARRSPASTQIMTPCPACSPARAAGVARMTGVELPVQPLRRMLVPTEPFPGLPERLPMMIDMSTGWHFRQEGLGLLMAWAHPDEQPGFRTDFDPDYIEKSLTHAASRVPDFANLAVNPKRCWAGMYEMSPDHH